MLCIYSSVLIAWYSWKRVNPFWKVKFAKYKFDNKALNNNCRSYFTLSFQNTMWQISYNVLHLFLCTQWRKDFSTHLYLKLKLNIFTLGLSCFEWVKINAFTRACTGGKGRGRNAFSRNLVMEHLSVIHMFLYFVSGRVVLEMKPCECCLIPPWDKLSKVISKSCLPQSKDLLRVTNTCPLHFPYAFQ